MGSVFSVHCSDCRDCTGRQPLYISKFEDNLQALETARDELIELHNDVMLTVINQQTLVRWWLFKVETTISQVTDLIERGKAERIKLCIDGFRSTKFKSSYMLGKSIAQSLKQVVDLNAGANFKDVVVMHEPAKQLQSDLEKLEITTKQLLALREDVKNRIDLEEGPEQRPPIQAQLWLSMVTTAILEADELIRDGPQEVSKFVPGEVSNYAFAEKVANNLGTMVTLMSQGDFGEVVGSTPSGPDCICQLQDDLKDLKSETVKLWALKEGVVKRVMLESGAQQRKPRQLVQLWLSDVEAMIMEVDKLVENALLEMEKLRLGDFSKYRMFVENVGRLLNDAIVLTANGDFKYVVERPFHERRVVRRIHEPTVGIEPKIEEAWSFLMRDYGDFLGVVGVGGIGKTTLLTLINNKLASTSNDFEVVILVMVSKDWKLDKIQDDIWKQIWLTDEKWSKRSFEEKAEDISYAMRGKKFALLLDNVWAPFDLELIGVPSPPALYGSKIVITSRSVSVCNKMRAKEIIRVKPLNAEDAWHLFHKRIGDIDANILPLARAVAQECFGLPIALVVVGGVMASKKNFEEWKHALSVLKRVTSNSEGGEDEVYHRLKFSYDCLPDNNVQSCFLYCSLFPESFKIHKNDLVHYWIRERFCCIDEGYFIVNSLIYKGLLEEEGKYVKMHDLIRDLALWIALKCEKEEHKYFVLAGSQLPEALKSEGAMTMSLAAKSFENFRMGNCSDVVTLFLSHNQFLCSIDEASLLSMDKLTILDLSKTTIEEFPAEISRLQLLQYLNLSHTRIRILPKVLILLRKLKYLNLDHTVLLQMIPAQLLSKLLELQVLKMFQCGSMVYPSVQDNLLANDNLLIQELLCLQNLIEVSVTIRRDHDFYNFCMEPRLLNCTRALALQAFKTKRSLNISSLASIKHLNVLLVFGNINVKELVVEVTEPRAASGLTNNQLIYSSLEEVVVSNYNGMRELTWLILAPNLTILRVTCNDYMEEIISPAKFGKLQDGDGSSNLFPKLQVLELYRLPKLKTIYWKALSFPCLRQIDVYKCPQLKKLPLNSNSAIGCKVVIKGQESWWKRLEWEDDATRAAFSSCFQKIRFLPIVSTSFSN